MAAAPHHHLEGTGAEISEYFQQRAALRFRVDVTEADEKPKAFDQAAWDESMRLIESLRGKSHSLPDEAFSTDSLYD